MGCSSEQQYDCNEGFWNWQAGTFGRFVGQYKMAGTNTIEDERRVKTHEKAHKAT